MAAASVLFAACGTADVLVTTERADQIRSADPADSDRSDRLRPIRPTPTDPTPTDPAEPSRNTSLDPIEPADPMGDPDLPDIDPSAVDPDAINFGDDKPARDYDDFLLASLGDIDTWLRAEFEPAFGQPYEPLQGQVYAGYPERTDAIPGCGEPIDELRGAAAVRRLLLPARGLHRVRRR